jgi:hypothetical protein
VIQLKQRKKIFSLIIVNEQINRFKSIIDNNHNGEFFENSQRSTTRLQRSVNQFLFFQRQNLSLHTYFFFFSVKISLSIHISLFSHWLPCATERGGINRARQALSKARYQTIEYMISKGNLFLFLVLNKIENKIQQKNCIF